MKERKTLESKIGMIGAFTNIIWLGIVFLLVFIRIEILNGRSDIGLISILFYSLFSAIALKSSSNYDLNKKNSIITLISTILLILNSLIFSILIQLNQIGIDPKETILYFLILIGPGILFLIPSSYLQLKNKNY